MHEIALEREGVAAAPSMERRVLSLAAPVIGENLLETLLAVVDTLLVARLGAEAVAGVGLAAQVMWFLIAALSAVAIGTTVLVAQAAGGQDWERARQLARQGVVWGVLLSVPLGLAGLLFSGSVVGLFGAEPAVAEIATAYLHISIGTAMVLVVLFIAGGILRGVGDSRTPMLGALVANVVNVALAYLLIFGHLGFPALGAVGSAWAALIGRLVAVSFVLVVLWHGRKGLALRGRRGWWPRWASARPMITLGIPAAFEQILVASAFMMFTALSSHLGTDVLAGQRIVVNVLMLSFLPGFGFALAATALVGQSIGGGRPDEAMGAALVARRWAVLWMSTIGLAVFVLAEPAVRFFTDDPGVVAQAMLGLRVIALAQPFWAVGIVAGGALRGSGDTRTPMLITAGGFWSAVALAYLGVNGLALGNLALWAGLALPAPAMAVVGWLSARNRLPRARALVAET